MKRSSILLAAVFVLGGCATHGSVGLITKKASNNAAVITSKRTVTDLGPAKARTCRHFLLGVIHWGCADIECAVDKALKGTGGNALINVAVSNTLYSFIPIYNVLGFTCTEVNGTAIKIE